MKKKKLPTIDDCEIVGTQTVRYPTFGGSVGWEDFGIINGPDVTIFFAVGTINGPAAFFLRDVVEPHPKFELAVSPTSKALELDIDHLKEVVQRSRMLSEKDIATGLVRIPKRASAILTYTRINYSSSRDPDGTPAPKKVVPNKTIIDPTEK